MANVNCLLGVMCPKCEQEDRFYITATACWEVCDDGTGEYEDVAWDDDSDCTCAVCGKSGVLKDFRVKESTP